MSTDLSDKGKAAERPGSRVKTKSVPKSRTVIL
jgi:hypothetical protein